MAKTCWIEAASARGLVPLANDRQVSEITEKEIVINCKIFCENNCKFNKFVSRNFLYVRVNQILK